LSLKRHSQERRRAFAAEHAAKESVLQFHGRMTGLEEQVEDLQRQIKLERVARREADDCTATYQRMYAELKGQWDSAKAEVVDFRNEVKTAMNELERDKNLAEATLSAERRRFAEERKLLEATAERIRATALTPERAAEVEREVAQLKEDIQALKTKNVWLTKDRERRSSYEPPVRWNELDRADLAQMHRAGTASHQIVVKLLQAQSRSRDSFLRVKAQLEVLSSVASAVEHGPLVATLLPGGGGHTAINTQVAIAKGAEDAAAATIRPLTVQLCPWAPQTWLLMDKATLPLLPPSVHQHAAIRQWCCAALFACAALPQPNMALALDRVCRAHFDFQTVAAFFATVLFRLRTTFAGDPFLAFFASLLTGERCAVAHAHQILLQIRSSLNAWEFVEKSLTGKATGKLPRPALLGALSAAFPLKTGAELLGLRQALFEQLDGRMTATGFVGPDGNIYEALPTAPTRSESIAPSLRGSRKQSTAPTDQTGEDNDAADATEAASEHGPSASDELGTGSFGSRPLVSFEVSAPTVESPQGSPRASEPVARSSRWHSLAAISYSDLFGGQALLDAGAASPFLVELCVQYERDVRRGEAVLEQRLAAAAVETGDGLFAGGVPQAAQFVAAWARRSSFAAELIFDGFGTSAAVTADDASNECPLECESDRPEATTATTPSASSMLGSMRRSMRASRSFGGTGLEKALKHLSMVAPNGGIATPHKLALMVLGALGVPAAGSKAAAHVPGTTTGVLPAALQMRLVPGAAAYGPESEVPRPHQAPVSDTPVTLSPDTAVPPTTTSLKADAVFAAAKARLPISGSLLLRVAAGSYVVPPTVFNSYSAAFTSGIHQSSNLHYDVLPVPIAANPTGRAASPSRGEGRPKKK
jgi:hypothetical protein